MNKSIIAFILLTFCPYLFAEHEVGLIYNQLSKELDGVDKNTNASGKLVSNGNPIIGLYYNWFITPRFHFITEYSARSFSFSDISKNLVGSEEVSSPIYNYGFKYVLSQSIAVSLVQENVKDISFYVNSDSKVELLSADNSYLKIGYHQLILLSGSNQIGFNAFYGLISSSEYIKNKTTMAAEGFWSIRGQSFIFTLNGGITKTSKESETLEFTENDNFYGVKLGFYL